MRCRQSSKLKSVGQPTIATTTSVGRANYSTSKLALHASLKFEHIRRMELKIRMIERSAISIKQYKFDEKVSIIRVHQKFLFCDCRFRSIQVEPNFVISSAESTRKRCLFSIIYESILSLEFLLYIKSERGVALLSSATWAKGAHIHTALMASSLCGAPSILHVAYTSFKREAEQNEISLSLSLNSSSSALSYVLRSILSLSLCFYVAPFNRSLDPSTAISASNDMQKKRAEKWAFGCRCWKNAIYGPKNACGILTINVF